MKITIRLDGLTHLRARQLAAGKGIGFHAYLQKLLKEGAAAERKLIEAEPCEVALEIDEETMSDLQRVSEQLASGAWGDYIEADASDILTKEVETEWYPKG